MLGRVKRISHNSVKINDVPWIQSRAHSESLCTGGICMRVFTARSWMHWHFLHCYASTAMPSSAHSSYCWLMWREYRTDRFYCYSLLEKNTNYTTQHTWASSFTDFHQVRKETLFHGEISFFCHKFARNSELCCRNSQTAVNEIRVQSEREGQYYYDCKLQYEWMERLHVLM